MKTTSHFLLFISDVVRGNNTGIRSGPIIALYYTMISRYLRGQNYPSLFSVGHKNEDAIPLRRVPKNEGIVSPQRQRKREKTWWIFGILCERESHQASSIFWSHRTHPAQSLWQLRCTKNRRVPNPLHLIFSLHRRQSPSQVSLPRSPPPPSTILPPYLSPSHFPDLPTEDSEDL